MKKVLVFGMTENPGGVESVIMNYYRAMDRSQVQFDFLCNSQTVAYEDEIQALGGVIYKIPARRDGRGAFAQALDQLMATHAGEYSAIWVNVCSLANIDYLKAAKKYGIPKRIIHSHNAANGDSFLRGLLHLYNRRVVRKLATDYWSCSDEASRWFFGADIMHHPRYRVIPNAIDATRYAPDPAQRQEYRRMLGVEDALVVGHVGRFHFQKNHNFLLHVVAEMKRMEPKTRLLLVGQGSEMESIRGLTAQLELEDTVQFLGVRSDLEGPYQAMDVFVFPSKSEGLGVVLLEAQANGLPCVTSDVVPHQVKVNDNLHFLPLEDGAQKWASFILNQAVRQGRVGQEQFMNSPYNMARQAQLVQGLLSE